MSTGDVMRAELHADVQRLSAQDRLALAFRLGDDDVAILCASKGLTIAEARAAVRRARSHGRRPSVANAPECR
jgi:hypothetical protein